MFKIIQVAELYFYVFYLTASLQNALGILIPMWIHVCFTLLKELLLEDCIRKWNAEPACTFLASSYGVDRKRHFHFSYFSHPQHLLSCSSPFSPSWTFRGLVYKQVLMLFVCGETFILMKTISSCWIWKHTLKPNMQHFFLLRLQFNIVHWMWALVQIHICSWTSWGILEVIAGSVP